MLAYLEQFYPVPAYRMQDYRARRFLLPHNELKLHGLSELALKIQEALTDKLPLDSE